MIGKLFLHFLKVALYPNNWRGNLYHQTKYEAIHARNHVPIPREGKTTLILIEQKQILSMSKPL